MEQLAELLNTLTTFIDSLTQLVTDAPITYLLIFALAAFDVIFPLLPAEASVTPQRAGRPGKLSIVTIMVAAGLGAFVGDNVAYWIRALCREAGRSSRSAWRRDSPGSRGGAVPQTGRHVRDRRLASFQAAHCYGDRRRRPALQLAQFIAYDALAAIVWSFQAALPGFIGGRLISDKPWLALIFGFVLSAILAVSIYLFQRWRSRTRPDVVPVRPAVVGIERIHRDADSAPIRHGPTETRAS
jgi:membrane protein DedA with SNARE-associated domain